MQYVSGQTGRCLFRGFFVLFLAGRQIDGVAANHVGRFVDVASKVTRAGDRCSPVLCRLNLGSAVAECRPQLSLLLSATSLSACGG